MDLKWGLKEESMVGWLYTNLLVFFCLPLLCVMIMESPSMPIAFPFGRGRDLGQWDPAIGTGPLAFVFHITLRDFVKIINKNKKTKKGGGPFQFLPVPCGDPKGLILGVEGDEPFFLSLHAPKECHGLTCNKTPPPPLSL